MDGQKHVHMFLVHRGRRVDCTCYYFVKNPHFLCIFFLGPHYIILLFLFFSKNNVVSLFLKITALSSTSFFFNLLKLPHENENVLEFMTGRLGWLQKFIWFHIDEDVKIVSQNFLLRLFLIHEEKFSHCTCPKLWSEKISWL